ncbi:hypothetical protein [Nonomuraea wenchangensis]|uniref:hypothetical protein n=1 Tax=Nonomuraea wenchangensis TaxID=568860 RepID=UPI0033324E6C
MSGVPVEAVAAAYGLGEPVGPAVYAARGELGRIWRLDTRRGSWAVKELLVPVREEDARADVAFQVAAAEAGVRLPRPVLTGGGDVVAGGRWRVYAWVDLVEGAQVTAGELGAVTAGLHRVGHPAAGPVAAWFAEPVGRGADITPENVRRATDGGIVVLDWENCGPASSAWELAEVLADLPEGAEGQAYRAYRDAGGPGRVTVAADFSMAVAEQGHLLEFYARRAMNPEESEENRTRAGARLRAMLARPLTRARIERLLKECARVSALAG